MAGGNLLTFCKRSVNPIYDRRPFVSYPGRDAAAFVKYAYRTPARDPFGDNERELSGKGRSCFGSCRSDPLRDRYCEVCAFAFSRTAHSVGARLGRCARRIWKRGVRVDFSAKTPSSFTAGGAG